MEHRFSEDDLGKKILLHLEYPVLLRNSNGFIFNIEEGLIVEIEDDSLILEVSKLDLTSLPYEMKNVLEEFYYKHIKKFRYL